MKLPAALQDQLSGFDDIQWRESHNVNKRKSRKEFRKENRQAKKQKRSVQPEKIIKTSKSENFEEPTNKLVSKPAKGELKSDRIVRPFVSAHDEDVRKKDEDDAKYYAKKLGLKSLKLKDENDGLGNILGDLDFDNFDSGDKIEHSDIDEEAEEADVYDYEGHDVYDDEDGNKDDDEELTAEETMRKLAALKAKKNYSGEKLKVVKEDDLEDDSMSDFSDMAEDSEEMIAEEAMAKLAALKRKPKDEVGEDDFSEISADEEGFSEKEELTAEETMAKLALKNRKVGNEETIEENDVEEDTDEGDSAESVSESESDEENPYVPPTRRAVTKVASTTDSDEKQKMRRAFKGALNKLTESTLPHVANEINLVFVKNSRSEASEVLTNELLDLIGGPQPLQHTLYTVYASLVAALYDSVGLSFAAHMVQVTVERLLQGGKPATNLLRLLIECYLFQVVTSRLPYDLMKDLLASITTTESLEPIELVLTIVRNGGSQLRSDDPGALKEIIVLLQQRIQQLGTDLSPRMRFLVDTVVALKNNRQKPVSELVIGLRHRLRKSMQKQQRKEPMQVGLRDILDSETRGKWWLVGASWKGNSFSSTMTVDTEEPLDIDYDEFGSSAIDWLELARKQRLNTDVRRAVFVALMGAEDYLDACLRLDKLGLSSKQNRDVPHVILHCLCQEESYNPFYALVAEKQCTQHSTMKTFQFRIWDWFATSPEGSPQTALHYARFYANLVSRRAMTLDVLKQADFLGASLDMQIFLNMFFVTFYVSMAIQAEKDARAKSKRGLSSVGTPKVERDGRELAFMLTKIREPAVLRGIQFINRDVTRSECIRSEKDADRVRWAAQFVSELVEELVSRG